MRPLSPRPNSGRKSNELVTWDSLCRFKGRRVGPNNEFPTTGNPFSLRIARVVALRDPQRRWNGSNGTRREVAWLENVQRLAGSRLDGSFGGNRTIRGPGEGESLLRRKRKSKGDEQISRRSSLYPRDLKPNGAAADPLKNGFTTCCWRSHLKIPLDIERISEKEGDTPVRVRFSIPRKYKSPDIKQKTVRGEKGEEACLFYLSLAFLGGFQLYFEKSAATLLLFIREKTFRTCVSLILLNVILTFHKMVIFFSNV